MIPVHHVLIRFLHTPHCFTIGKSKTIGVLILRGFHCRSGGIPLRAATSIVATVHRTCKNPKHPKGHSGFLCRSGGIRTRGLLVPNQTRYQTALHLDAGADEGTRTPDLLITNRLLYQLSHIGTTSKRYYNKGKMVCPALFLPAGSVDRQALVCYTAAESEPSGPGRFHCGRNEP